MEPPAPSVSERASGDGRPRSLRLPSSSPTAAGYRDKACAARSTDGLALASPHSTRAMREADARDCRGGRVFWITIVCVSDTSYLSNVVPPVVVVVDFFCFVFFYPRNAALEGISRRFLKGLAGRLSPLCCLVPFHGWSAVVVDVYNERSSESHV